MAGGDLVSSRWREPCREGACLHCPRPAAEDQGPGGARRAQVQRGSCRGREGKGGPGPCEPASQAVRGMSAVQPMVGPIDVAAAPSLCQEDKRMIDGFAQKLPGGFDSANRIITDRLLEPLE